ncbi:acyl-CoA thioesterase [Pseudobacteriovorax antillogorgiicola]|uniref:Acyl-CoA hydrolase n=1 Tax=Pseudobacteriovorax antillogorgiicola TaxID=1513793 RepID=A0A1Y6BB72_9BACT|nr:acyl-CoA thioesterase [Pseudobacteriovorax antillogorgiicola]TCS57333.1 acyl-CoA hydrolase [Pseudobacteriovorax antillogorgiicola]SMF02388.1 Acyl-CoA hydrolase [Pseudobacteriovorax antillogorgiicola]
MRAIYPQQTAVTMTEVVMPQHTNPHGSVFGGVIMSWVDIAAGICATRHCRRDVVTASVDTLHFLSPVRLGWIVTLKAMVNYAGKTSCEVGVRIDAENGNTGEVFHTASAYLTMVAMGSDHRPSTIPPLEPQTELEKQRFEQAKNRITIRRKLRQMMADEDHIQLPSSPIRDDD